MHHLLTPASINGQSDLPSSTGHRMIYSYNPLIDAPHVPPKTTAPNWGKFLDPEHDVNSQSITLSKCSHGNGEQQHPCLQVGAAKQRDQQAQPALHQQSSLQQNTQQVQASSRWRSQPRHQTTQQPNRQAITGSAGQQSGGGWIARKKAQHLAAQGAQTDKPATEQQTQLPLYLQQPPDLQQQLGPHSVTNPAYTDLTAEQPSSRGVGTHMWTDTWHTDEADVQLPSDDEVLEPAEHHNNTSTAYDAVFVQQQPAVQYQQTQASPSAGTPYGVHSCKLATHIHESESFNAGNKYTTPQARTVHAGAGHCMRPIQSQNDFLQGVTAASSSFSAELGIPHVQQGQQRTHSFPRQHDQSIFVLPDQHSLHHQQQRKRVHCDQLQQGQQAAHTAQAASATRWSAGAAANLQSLRRPKQQRPQAASASAKAPAKSCSNHNSPVASLPTKQRSSKQGMRDSSIGSGQNHRNQSTTVSGAQVAPGNAWKEKDVQEKQDKMHQETVFSVLMRSQRNQQLQQQQQTQTVQNKQNSKGSKRSNGTAEAAQQTSDNKGSAQFLDDGTGAAQSGGHVKPGKKARRSAQAAGAPIPGAIQELDLWVLDSKNNSSTSNRHNQAADSAKTEAWQSKKCYMVDLSSKAAEQQLCQLLASAEGVVLGLLMSQTAGAAVQYYTSLQELTKEQQQLLRRHVKASRSTAAANNTENESGGVDGLGVSETVGIAIMPVTTAAAATQQKATSSSNSSRSFPMYYLHLLGDKADARQQHRHLPPTMMQLLSKVITDTSRPFVCSNAKAVLCSLSQLGLQLPSASSVSLVDPEVLAWLLNPQLVQDSKSAACYSLQQQMSGKAPPQAASLAGKEQASGPLQDLHQQLHQALYLADELLNDLKTCVAGEAIMLEMQTIAVLAKMELAGVGVYPQYLSQRKSTLLQRVDSINSQATCIAGRPFNLSSSSQLAAVLYEHLKLPVPTVGGGRSCAKTHLSTDEHTLKQLAALHPLPGLVLEYRCIQNVLCKWIDSEWMREATQQSDAVGGSAVVDVHCSWNQVATATGRLSSNSPNLQAVTKYTISTPLQQQQHQNALHSSTAASSVHSINIRDLFVARAGSVLLSADYSQIELRLLAHFSEDRLLRQLLHQSGSEGDVFKLIAAAWMKPGATAGNIDAATRECAKRVVYGIIYGLSAYGLSQQLADQGVSVDEAKGLIDSFLSRFQGVRQFMLSSLQHAQVEGNVKTLMQRVRPITGLTATSYKDRSAMERRVVNSIMQGSAADLIKLAMRDWDDWAATATADATHQQPQKVAVQPAAALIAPADADASAPAATSHSSNPGRVGARLIAQIHDELLFEVDAADTVLLPDGSVVPGPHLQHVARVVEDIMGMQKLQLSVPLRVNLSCGPKWGSLQRL